MYAISAVGFIMFDCLSIHCQFASEPVDSYHHQNLYLTFSDKDPIIVNFELNNHQEYD